MLIHKLYQKTLLNLIKNIKSKKFKSFFRNNRVVDKHERDDVGIKAWRRRRSSVYPAMLKSKFGKSDKTNLKIKIQSKEYKVVDAIFEQAALEYFKVKTNYQKFSLAVIVGMLMTLTICQCVDSVQRYMDWKVRTQITTETVRELKYPSLTFCSVNDFRKSVVGSNLLVHVIYAFMTISDVGQAIETAINSSKLCKRANETDTNDFQKFIDTALAIKKVSEFNKYAHIAGVDSFLSVVKCWWNDKEFDCRNSFNNYVYDHFMCFTFNSNLELNDFIGGDSYGYGYNETDRRQKIVTTSGRNQGLRILLNTHQEEYCGLFNKWVGAGFVVLINDFDRPQSFNNHAPLGLAPGYQTNVVMKPTTFDRRTEFMGTCKSNADLFLIPLTTKRYSEEVCYSQCIMEMVWIECKCLPTNMESVRNLTAKHYGIPLEKVNLCVTLTDVQCFKKLGQNGLLSKNTDKYCGCKTPCYNNQYSYQVSQQSLPLKQLQHYLNTENTSMDAKTIKKNFLLASFSFENMNVEFVLETQLFTISDLLIYIGNSCGLFLGWSFISMVGLIAHLKLYIYLKSREWLRNIKLYYTQRNKFRSRRNTITKRRPTLAELYL